MGLSPFGCGPFLINKFQKKKKIENKLKEPYHEEDIYWEQKSINFWLKMGDKNTKYFHASTKKGQKIRFQVYMDLMMFVKNEKEGWKR